MEIKAFFGTNLKYYRRRKNLSQEQLAERLAITVKHLSKIERGMTFVSADLLEKLAATLDISAAHFFCRESEKIYDDTALYVFDRITEAHLIRAMDGIKTDIRRSNLENADTVPDILIPGPPNTDKKYELPPETDDQVIAAENGAAENSQDE